jgi:hypothetical protein
MAPRSRSIWSPATTLTVEDLDDFADSGGDLFLSSLENAEDVTTAIRYAGVDRTTNRVLLAATWIRRLSASPAMESGSPRSRRNAART